MRPYVGMKFLGHSNAWYKFLTAGNKLLITHFFQRCFSCYCLYFLFVFFFFFYFSVTVDVQYYYFQVYNLLIRYLCNLSSDRSYKSSNYLTLYVVITIFPMLYFTSPVAIL